MASKTVHCDTCGNDYQVTACNICGKEIPREVALAVGGMVGQPIESPNGSVLGRSTPMAVCTICVNQPVVLSDILPTIPVPTDPVPDSDAPNYPGPVGG